MDVQRGEQRYRAYAKVKCQKYGSGYGALMILKNISKSGARLNLITAASQFFKGDLLRLIVELEGVKRNHIVNAEVVWSKEGALGVSFLTPDNFMIKNLTRNGPSPE